MAICNRDLGSSEQVRNSTVHMSTAGSSIQVTYPIAQAPYPCTLEGVAIAAVNVSNAPVVSISISRYTSGGATLIPYASTTMVVAPMSASAAYQSISLAAPGNSLIQLQAGDVVVLVQEIGTTMQINRAVVSVGLKALQDIRSYFGVVYGS